jgi:CubicO group peptidase (beta-lactamase class C family)
MLGIKTRSKRTKLFMATSICALAMALAAPALAAADWGAIAVSPRTGKVGVAYDYPTAHRAKKRALHECHQLGCQVAVWVRNQYAALVLKHNGVFVAGVGPTKNLAFAKARDRAHDHTAKKWAWIFSGY